MNDQSHMGQDGARQGPEKMQLPTFPRKRRKGKLLLGLLLIVVLLGIYGGSVPYEGLQDDGSSRMEGEWVRGEVFDVGSRSKLVLIEDNQGRRAALSYLKTPFLDRYKNKDTVLGNSREQSALSMQVDDGFATMDVRVKFKSLHIDDIKKWNGSYTRSLSILVFAAVSVLLSFTYRSKKPGQGNR